MIYHIYIFIYISTINIHKSVLLYGAHTHIVGDARLVLYAGVAWTLALKVELMMVA